MSHKRTKVIYSGVVGKNTSAQKRLRAARAALAGKGTPIVNPALLRTGGRMPVGSGELKNVDVSSSALIVAAQTTATALLLNGLAQGTTATTRIGRRVTLKSLYFRFQASMAATSAGASPIRLLVVYDKQTNATPTTAGLVLASDALNSLNLLDNARRFVTLCDVMLPCLGTGGPQAVAHVFYKKINLPMEFNTGSAGTVGDIQTGSIYMLAFQNGGIITANPTQAFNCRIRYTD